MALIKTKHRQSFIANQLGVRQGTVSMWLNLKAKPTGLTRAALESRFPDLAKQIEAAWKEKIAD